MRYALAPLLLAAGCAVTPPADDAATLAQAERDFAAHSMRTDMNAAFLAHFAEDGVLVRGGWTTARAALTGRPPPPIRLDWAPSHVEVAASGDLGLSTGPWVITSQAQAPAHGHFVSVWRRSEANAAWKVEVDLGIPHPDAVALPPAAQATAAHAGPADAGSLEEAEVRFVQASLRSGPRAAYAGHALPRFMLYREGHVPWRGRQSALASGALDDAPLVWLADARAVSRAGDFGYVRGRYADAADPSRVRGYFLRVWRREAAGWGIALDVTNAAR